MAQVHRTHVNRGKHEITEFKSGYVYAVEYTLPSDYAQARGVQKQQIGLMVLDMSGTVSRNWNINKLNQWDDQPFTLDMKHVWYASEQEVAFAHTEEARLRERKRLKAAVEGMAAVTKKVEYYEHNPLHCFVEKVIRQWRELKKFYA